MEDSAPENKEKTTKKEATQTETAKNDAKPLDSPKPNKSKKQLIIYILAAVIVLGVIASMYIIGQSNLNNKVSEFEAEKKKLTEQVASQSAQLNKLEKGKSDLNSRISFLERTLKEATAPSKFEIVKLSLISVLAKQFTYRKGDIDETNLLLVDVEVKNDTDQTLFLSKLSFKLKDINNKSYSIFDIETWKLPSGTALLFDQQMTSGETVSGTVVFEAPKSIKLFTLLYENNERTLTVK